MKTYLINFLSILFFLSAGFQYDSDLSAQTISTVKGIVFHDANGNGLYDVKVDSPLKNIAVSNGREVVLTNKSGMYEIPAGKNSVIFVIKPPQWKFPVDYNQLSHFYYLYSPGGIPGKSYEGLPPTGSLPESLNFPLYPNKEPDNFDVLVLGDPQPRDEKEINYFSRDVLPELVDLNVSLGITLGDIVFDKLELYQRMISTLSTIGVPMYYVPGNHDNDHLANTQEEARSTWLYNFGPTYYSFSYGPVHFITLDNVRWISENNKRFYRTGLGEDQMEFLKNEIRRLKNNQLLILLSHIPFERSTAWKSEDEKKAFFELIASHPNTISFSAHSHRHYHQFVDKKSGFPGIKPLHIVSVGTSCGALWTGAPDVYGIPNTMMSDGTPNCYTILHINKNECKLSWKAARRPADFQMHIDVPEFVLADSTMNIKVIANIFNALPSAEVKMKIGPYGNWYPMERNPVQDPYRIRAQELDKQLGNVPWRPLGNTGASEHIWTAEPKLKLDPGVYVIYVKAVDDWWEYEGKQILHVK